MRYTLFLCVLVFISVISVNCQQKNQNLNEQKSLNKINAQCLENSDSLYVRQKVLEQFANILNSSIPEFKEKNGFGFYVKNEQAKVFGIYDLTDISNKYLSKNDCINFVNNHIYHVFPSTYDFSFSHIIILENGILKVFKSINCKDKGDTVQDVITYLNQKLWENDINKEQILERVKNFRKYGEYHRIDNFSRLLCKENP